MTKDEIIKQEMQEYYDGAYADHGSAKDQLERFASAVAAAEREACAKVCETAIGSIFELSDEHVKETGRNVCTNLAKIYPCKGAAMNRENIIKLAREAGFMRSQITVYNCERLERFASLVIKDFLTTTGQYLTNDASREAAIAAEREACASLCDPKPGIQYSPNTGDARKRCAEAIRARGQQS